MENKLLYIHRYSLMVQQLPLIGINFHISNQTSNQISLEGTSEKPPTRKLIFFFRSYVGIALFSGEGWIYQQGPWKTLTSSTTFQTIPLDSFTELKSVKNIYIVFRPVGWGVGSALVDNFALCTGVPAPSTTGTATTSSTTATATSGTTGTPIILTTGTTGTTGTATTSTTGTTGTATTGWITTGTTGSNDPSTTGLDRSTTGTTAQSTTGTTGKVVMETTGPGDNSTTGPIGDGDGIYVSFTNKLLVVSYLFTILICIVLLLM